VHRLLQLYIKRSASRRATTCLGSAAARMTLGQWRQLLQEQGSEVYCKESASEAAQLQ